MIEYVTRSIYGRLYRTKSLFEAIVFSNENDGDVIDNNNEYGWYFIYI